MSTESGFKSMRITMSEEAFDGLERIMNKCKFRSYSSTVEECIRLVDDLMASMTPIIGKPDDPHKVVPTEIKATAFDHIVTRMSRFTGRVIDFMPKFE